MKRSEMRTAALIAGTYLLIAETWDVLSDIFFTNLTTDSGTLAGSLILKDLIFSLLNALLLYFILRREFSILRKNELTLREQGARLRLMVEKMPAILWSTDLDGSYTYSVGAGLAKLGLEPNELVGRRIAETRTEQDSGTVLNIEKHRQVIEKGMNASYDLQWGDLYYHCELEPLRNEVGAIQGVIGVALDTTDQVKAFQMLEQRVDERTHEIERRRLVAEGLREIVATLNSNQPLEKILSFIVFQANHLLQASSVGLYLRKEDQTLSAQAAAGWDADVQKGMVFQPGQGLVGQAVQQRQLVSAHRDISQSGQTPESSQPAPSWFADEVAIPLIVKSEALGAIRLTYRKPNSYTNEENELALTITDQTRLAIENANLRRQAEILAVINERSRLSRDLHDSVAQSIYSMTLMAEAARRMQDAGDLEPARVSLLHLGNTAQQALKEIRLLVYELRPDVLEREGLLGALQQRLDAVEGRAGVETRLICAEPLKLPFQVEEALYWIAQEALNNALKHANASQVQVTIHTQPEIVSLEIVDNGLGFDTAHLPDSGGMGLSNMRERVTRLNGIFEIQSRINEGTRVKISFHLNA